MKMTFSPGAGWSHTMQDILQSHDVVFRAPVPDQTYGLPIGNGDSGCLLWFTDQSIRIALNKTDLWDLTTKQQQATCSTEPEDRTVCRHGGELVLDFGCPIFETLYQNRFEARLSLYDAVARVQNSTPFGEVVLSAFSDEQSGVSVIQTRVSYTEALSLRLTLQRFGSRSLFFWYNHFLPGTDIGLSGTDTDFTPDTLVLTQQLNGSCFAVAVKLETDTPFTMTKNGSHILHAATDPTDQLQLTAYVAVATGGDTEEARRQAILLTEKAAASGATALYRQHAANWAGFWAKSFVSLPAENDFLENLWYLNLYYANSEMKGKSPAHFCNGIWGFYHDFVPWNHFFHYNMQLATFPLEAANHPELLETYYDFRVAQLPRAKAFAKEFKHTDGAFYADVCDKDGRNEVGTVDNCTCGAQIAMYLYNHYLFSGDKNYLTQKALPVMEEVGKFYLDVLQQGEDGLYHIHATQGYEGSPLFDDSITDLVMVRVLFAALAAELPEGQAAVYRDRLAKLTPYTETEMFPEEVQDGVFLHGLGKGLPTRGNRVLSVGKQCEDGQWIRRTFGKEERDWYGFPDTEMAPVFPAGLVGIGDKDTPIYDEIYNSLCLHHPAAEDGEDGYCMGWCMMPIYLARMGLSALLQKQLYNTVSAWMVYPQGFGTYGPQFNHIQMRDRFCKNQVTVYGDGGKRTVPAWNFRHFDYETLPILATAINEMLLQSYDGTLRLFGAVPENYSCAFSLKAAGGFEVHAVYEKGQADVFIYAARGGKLTVSVENICRPVVCTDGEGAPLGTVCQNTVTVPRTGAGQWVHITASDSTLCRERDYQRNEGIKTMGRAQLGTWEEFC